MVFSFVIHVTKPTNNAVKMWGSIPGPRPKSCHQSLQHPPENDERVLPGGSEVDQGQGDESMDEEPQDDRQHVHPQSLHHRSGVVNVQDLPTHQEHDTHRRVPVNIGQWVKGEFL